MQMTMTTCKRKHFRKVQDKIRDAYEKIGELSFCNYSDRTFNI